MNDYIRYLEDLELEDERYRKPRNRPKRTRAEVMATLVEQGDDTRQGFNPTFHASRHERAWILNYLGGFYEDHVITDVLRQVKGGKEANVYCCAAGQATGVELIAAKVYRPRMFRNLRNDSVYREGRDVLDSQGKQVRGRREQLAMKKKTEFGQSLLHTAWVASEFETLSLLHEAGVDIPKPFAYSDNAILMDYIGREGAPAPTLISVTLKAQESGKLFDKLIANIELMLANERVHADLSAHNVLYWQGDIKIIDFPQAVDPYINPNSRWLFGRDVKRICQYFERYGIAANSEDIAGALWSRYMPG